MELEELKQKRKETEVEIERLIRNFEYSVGVKVKDIDFNSIDIGTNDNPNDTWPSVKLEVRVDDE